MDLKQSAAILFCTGITLGGCTRGADLVAAYGDPRPSRDAVTVCHGYGCAYRSTARIAAADWREVAAAFRDQPSSAAGERRAVARAIALIEDRIGAQVGTAADKPGAAIVAADPYQQDCIDEAVNTTTYLRLLAGDGLLRFHRVGEAAWRGHFIDGWPHNTAVLVENGSGAAFAIDSWFFANGVEPAIVPLEEWQAGWHPESA